MSKVEKKLAACLPDSREILATMYVSDYVDDEYEEPSKGAGIKNEPLKYT